MSPGDAIHWTNPETGRGHPCVFIARYGSRIVIEAVTPTGHLGLRYVDPEDVRPTSIPTGDACQSK